jgi:hypothetical protein
VNVVTEKDLFSFAAANTEVRTRSSGRKLKRSFSELRPLVSVRFYGV